MDILGIGGWELIAIVAIMLVVAGPKRMIAWSYTAGQYMAKLRQLWAETAQHLQREFDAAGVEVKVPQQIPTRATLNRDLARAFTPITKPLTEAQSEMRAEMKAVTAFDKIMPQNKTANAAQKREPLTPAAPIEIAVPASPAVSAQEPASYGTWAGR